MKEIKLLLIILSIGLSFSAQAKDNKSAAPILIGEVNTYSGPAAVFSNPYKLGMTIAIEELNSVGGVAGRQLQIIHKDDGLNPVETRKVSQELVLKDKVDFLVGGLVGSTCQALADVAKENKKFFMSTLCVIDPEDSHGHRLGLGRSTYGNRQLVGALAKRAIKEFPNAKKWLLIGSNETSGKNIVGGFKEALKKLKPDVVIVNEMFPQFGTTDYSSQITAISASGADAVFSGLWGGDSITFTKQAKSFKLFNKIKFASYTIGSLEESYAIGADNIEGAVSTGYPFWDEQYMKSHTKLAAFVGKFTKANNGNPPGGAAFMGYQTIMIIAKALENSGGKTDVKKFSEGLSKDFNLDLPWGKVHNRGCDRMAYIPVPTGMMSPTVADKKQSFMVKIEEYDGLEFARPCQDIVKETKK